MTGQDTALQRSRALRHANDGEMGQGHCNTSGLSGSSFKSMADRISDCWTRRHPFCPAGDFRRLYGLDGPASFAYNLQTSTTHKLTRYIEPVAQIHDNVVLISEGCGPHHVTVCRLA